MWGGACFRRKGSTPLPLSTLVFEDYGLGVSAAVQFDGTTAAHALMTLKDARHTRKAALWVEDSFLVEVLHFRWGICFVDAKMAVPPPARPWWNCNKMSGTLVSPV